MTPTPAGAARLPLKHRAELWLARWARRWYALRRPRLAPAPVPRFVLHSFGAADAPPRAPNAAAIPPILWAYWRGTAPLLVQRCVAQWQRLHPHFSVRILDERSVLRYLPAMPAALADASPAKQSDWVRLELLLRHGGIWLDASTILTQPLDWAIQEQARTGADFVGYYLERFTRVPQRPVVENWFMAAPPASPFIADLQREFIDQVVPRSGEQYIDSLRAQGLYEQAVQLIEPPAYLSMHLALQAIVLRGGRYRLSLACAEEGPFFYHRQGRWSRTALKAQLFFTRIDGPVPPLVKLRAPDRRRLDEYLARGLYLPDSLAGRWLMRDDGLQATPDPAHRPSSGEPPP